jgi:hypothetical protein
MSKKLFLLVILVSIIPHFTFSQVDSVESIGSKLVFIPSLHNIQIDATSIVVINQFGAEIDLDVLRSVNEEICIGTRFSVEHYYLYNFVEKIDGSPFTNYNLFARFSISKSSKSIRILKGDVLAISLLSGFTCFAKSNQSTFKSRYLFRFGFEVEYSGFVLKGPTSFIKNSSFIGIGLCLGYDHLK